CKAGARERSGGADRRLHLRERGGVDLGDAVIALRVDRRLLQDLLLRLTARFDRAPRKQIAASQNLRHGSVSSHFIRDWPWPGPARASAPSRARLSRDAAPAR